MQEQVKARRGESPAMFPIAGENKTILSSTEARGDRLSIFTQVERYHQDQTFQEQQYLKFQV